MTVALFNTTPIVEKLVERLTQKRGDTLYKASLAHGADADVVIVDDSVLDRYGPQTAKEQGRYTLLIGSRFEPAPEGYDAVLAKPFLPEELSRALDDAELAVSASLDRTDMFDADEAASLWEGESGIPEEHPVFDRTEIDELKQLLEAVEDEAPELYIEETRQSYEQETRPTHDEVLYDADEAGYASDAAETEEDDFGEIDLHARGVEALQDLMAILSDESVAKAFKAIGVRVDISFGEKA